MIHAERAMIMEIWPTEGPNLHDHQRKAGPMSATESERVAARGKAGR
jgi:hypothetical protein